MELKQEREPRWVKVAKFILIAIAVFYLLAALLWYGAASHGIA